MKIQPPSFRARAMRLVVSIVLLTGLLSFAAAPLQAQPAAAQSNEGEIVWTAPINLSNTPDNTSTDPFLLADPAGVAHMFWAEKEGFAPGSSPDTIVYSRWDGETWTQPVDLFFAPLSDGTPVVGYPHAVIDNKGTIHLIWVSEPNFPHYTLNYSSAPANQAGFVQAWSPKIELAGNLTGSKYSSSIAITPTGELHVAYATGAAGDNQTEERGLAYLRSTDGGQTWSAPATVFTSPVNGWGVSDIRMAAESAERTYMTWTLWNDVGNGHAIYFSRTEDGGATWEEPIILAEQLNPDEYERDWNALAVLEPGKLVTMWEGGFRAYRFARYSYDGGETWTEQVDLFPWLIGENGYVEFARDSLDRLHLFIAQRHREGSDPGLRTIEEGTEETLWHSVWLGDEKWTDPQNPGGYYGMNNPKVAIVGGNKVVAAFYVPPTYDITVMTGKIMDAPPLEPKPWPEATLVGRASVTETAAPETGSPVPELPTETPTPTPVVVDGTSGPALSPNVQVMIGIAPVLLILPLFVLFKKLRRKPE